MNLKTSCLTVLFCAIGLVLANDIQVQVQAEDVCDEIECEENRRCFQHGIKLENGTKVLKGVCLLGNARNLIIEDENNNHIHYQITCPDYQDIGLFGDKIDCGPYRDDPECENDFYCSSYKICCYDGCWSKCAVPILSKHSP